MTKISIQEPHRKIDSAIARYKEEHEGDEVSIISLSPKDFHELEKWLNDVGHINFPNGEGWLPYGKIIVMRRIWANNEESGAVGIKNMYY